MGGSGRIAAALAAALIALAPGGVAAQEDAESSLRAVREQIAELERRLARESRLRDDASAALESVEREAAAARAELARLDARLSDQKARAATLDESSRTARSRLAAERAALADQLRLAYVNGREEALKLLLSQESPAAFGRMLVYYDYFNRARSRRIRAVLDELETLARLEDEAAAVQADLEATARERAAELETLERARREREAVLAELDETIEAGGGELERLRAEEQRLVKLVTELGELLAAYPAESEAPFPELRGRLAWPVVGKIVADFDTPRGGGLRWNGVLFAAPRGAPVRAVYHGRVAFADWLPGLGLLMIVDHGDGYMSLYAHNDALLKEPGDVVRPGEPIAEVGDTGGRAEPSLYFEIRHAGEPVDPHAWIAD
ncbi:MAG TPA: peptidoglycan DD-metalloendopeptidase family protein [Gammaproteobacteria bacterium]